MKEKNKSLRILKFIFNTIMASLLFACNQDQSPPPPTTKAELESYFEQIIKQNNILGASLVVMKANNLVKELYTGKSELSGQAVNKKTRFQLASASKIFTGTLAMIFVEKDSINLNDQLGDYLSDIPEKWKSIELWQLLSHTSGLPRMLNPETGQMLGTDLEETYAKSKNIDPLNIPGEEWNYNQLGFFLIGQILEKVTDQTWENLLRNEIFKPLDMQYTDYSKNQFSAESYSIINSDAPTPFEFDYLVKQAGGLYTTSEDMTKFIKGLLSNQLITEATKELMWSKVKLNDGSNTEYGLGWDMRTIHGEQTVGHSGGRKAVVTHFINDQITVILMTNTYGSDPIQYTYPIKAAFN